MGVDPEAGGRQLGADLIDRVGDIGRERAAVGVAEDQVFGAGAVRRAQHLQRVVGVLGETVEEVLGVEVNLAPERRHVLERLADHREVLLERRVQDRVDLGGDALADEGHNGRVRLAQRDDVEVGRGVGVGLAGPAEGHEFGVLQRPLLHAFEEGLVLLIAAGEAALHIVDAELIEAMGDGDLVGQREGDAFHLRAVAEQGVVEHHTRSCEPGRVVKRGHG